MRKVKRSKPSTKLNDIVKYAARSIIPSSNLKAVIRSAMRGAREAVRRAGGKSKVIIPRVLPIPKKVGGFLPLLIPIFAGLSAAGALAGGAAGIVKAVNDSKSAKDALEETRRHNRKIEDISVSKVLYLKPHKTGMGLFLRPHIGNSLRQKKKILEVRLPQRVLTDSDIVKFAKILKIPHF